MRPINLFQENVGIIHLPVVQFALANSEIHLLLDLSIFDTNFPGFENWPDYWTHLQQKKQKKESQSYLIKEFIKLPQSFLELDFV